LVTLDTDILVSLLKGTPDAVERVRNLLETEEQLSTTMISAYELVKGAYISSRRDENLAKVTESIASLRLLELSIGAVEESARIYNEVKEKGKMIGEFDILIAGITKFNDETLVTRDDHFKTIRGIKLIKW